jgi:hypothetical protein
MNKKTFTSWRVSKDFMAQLKDMQLDCETYEETARRILDMRPAPHSVDGRVVPIRKSKYPLRDLKVGESVLLPWRCMSPGIIDNNQEHLRLAVYYEEKKRLKSFQTQKTDAGLLVKRML